MENNKNQPIKFVTTTPSQMLPEVRKVKRIINKKASFGKIRSLKDLEEDENFEQEFFDNFPDRD
jgi:hypothetical protein